MLVSLVTLLFLKASVLDCSSFFLFLQSIFFKALEMLYFNIELDTYSLFIWCRSTTTHLKSCVPVSAKVSQNQKKVRPPKKGSIYFKREGTAIGWENLQCDAKQCCSKCPFDSIHWPQWLKTYVISHTWENMDKSSLPIIHLYIQVNI